MSQLLNLESLSSFSRSYDHTLDRINLYSGIISANNELANDVIERHEKVHQIIKPIMRLVREGAEVKNWTGVHVPFIHTFVDTCNSLHFGSSISKGRGYGRGAALIDNCRYTGAGFAKSLPAIMHFNGLDRMEEFEDLETVVVQKKALIATFPVANMLMKSGPLFARMLKKLQTRQELIKKGRRLTQEEKNLFLIKGQWTPSLIIEHTVEFAARSFAFGLAEKDLEEIATSDLTEFSLRNAFESLRPKMLVPA
jgi:hypothetical protein